MIHFEHLERAGLRLALMTDKSDGDCGSRPGARASVDALLRRLSAKPECLVRVKQVHGVRIVDAQAAMNTPADAPIEADGLVTQQPGIALCVSVADCAPVLLFDPCGGAVAVLHAGREGTRQNIAGAGVQALADRFAARPTSLLALIGPCAGPCCYEVSPSLAAAWREAGLPARGRRLDLPGANRLQLENAGVIRHNIRVVSHCTVCGGEFFSYRAEKTSNRNLVLVMS